MLKYWALVYVSRLHAVIRSANRKLLGISQNFDLQSKQQIENKLPNFFFVFKWEMKKAGYHWFGSIKLATCVMLFLTEYSTLGKYFGYYLVNSAIISKPQGLELHGKFSLCLSTRYWLFRQCARAGVCWVAVGDVEALGDLWCCDCRCYWGYRVTKWI